MPCSGRERSNTHRTYIPNICLCSPVTISKNRMHVCKLMKITKTFTFMCQVDETVATNFIEVWMQHQHVVAALSVKVT